MVLLHFEHLVFSHASEPSGKTTRSSSPPLDVLRCSDEPSLFVLSLSQSGAAIDPGADHWELVDLEVSGRRRIGVTARPPPSP